jgi:hypothetical protein
MGFNLTAVPGTLKQAGRKSSNPTREQAQKLQHTMEWVAKEIKVNCFESPRKKLSN